MRAKRLILSCLGFAALFAAIWAYLWYDNWRTERVSPVSPDALWALESDREVEVTNERWIVFRPRKERADTALIFYPGGECDERGYAEPLRRIAAAGYLVVLVPMPFYLAVLAPERASEVLESFPEIANWAIAGHSLGGAMAARYVFRNPQQVDGLLLWDAYPPDTDDISGRDLKVTIIHRSDASRELPGYYADYLHALPEHTEFVPIVGASHINFGRFEPALRFRQSPPATISIEEQHRLIADASIEFLDNL
jgi:pimeloyl-ACP methyl ester carboxylesterase